MSTHLKILYVLKLMLGFKAPTCKRKNTTFHFNTCNLKEDKKQEAKNLMVRMKSFANISGKNVCQGRVKQNPLYALVFPKKKLILVLFG